MHYYFSYFIRCLIRNFARLLFKPKFFFTILIILVLLFFSFKINSFAAEGEPVISYNTVDGITVDSSGIISFNGFKCYYIPVYKNQTISYAYTTASPAEIRTCFTTQKPSVGVSISGGWTQSNRDTGYSIEIVQQSSINGYFCVFVYPFGGFEGITFYDNSSTSDAIVNQTQQIIESDKQNTQDIIDNNDKNTEEIIANDNKNSQELQNTITDSSFEDSSITIDSSVSNIEQEESYNNFLMNIMNRFKDTVSTSPADDSPIEITFPIPFTDKSITLYSDMISKHISNTVIYVYLQVFYLAYFGWHLFKVGFRIINYFSEGSFLEQGLSPLINNLNEQNAIIKPFMM